MVCAFPDVYALVFLQYPLHALCPRGVARFVTDRYRLSATAWIDRTFFDQEGIETCDVCTFLYGDLSSLSQLTLAPTKIVDYLCRFRPSLYQIVVQRQAHGTRKGPAESYTVKLAEPVKPRPCALDKDELPLLPKTQLAHIADPKSISVKNKPSSASGWTTCAKRQASWTNGWSVPSLSENHTMQLNQSMMPMCGPKSTSPRSRDLLCMSMSVWPLG